MQRSILMLLALLTLSFSAMAAVNLNTANQAELESLKGVGPAKAEAIIEYRKKNGPFKSVDDLDNVKGFGPKATANLKGQVTVGGSSASTAAKAEKK